MELQALNVIYMVRIQYGLMEKFNQKHGDKKI